MLQDYLFMRKMQSNLRGNKEFINKESRKILLEALDLGLNFKTSSSNLINYRDLEDIKKDLLEPIPVKSKNIKQVLKICEQKIVSGAVNFSNPHFLAFPDCGNSTSAMCGHIVSGMLNQNLINSMHCSPTATFVEMAVINWFREIVGYKVNTRPSEILDVGGINVPGGTLANTVALLLAREKILPNTMSKGLFSNKPLRMFIPEGIGHYTSKAAISWLGIGSENIIEVKITKDFMIDKKDLVKKIKLSQKEGTPFALIAYAGDSRTMAIDDFPELSKIAKRYGLWFHIDACHGASLCFSDKMKKKIKGINLADSVTIDPHKVLFVPYPASYILVKDPANFKAISGVSDLITKEKYSFGQITPFLGSRPFNSLKLWFLIKNLGKKKIGGLIEKRHIMATYFSSLVKKNKNFCLMNNVEINSVAYIYLPNELRELIKKSPIQENIDLVNDLNLNIQKRMFKEGKFYVHTFRLNDFKNVLRSGSDKIYQMQRLMLGNPLTEKKDLISLIKYSEVIGKEEWLKIRSRLK